MAFQQSAAVPRQAIQVIGVSQDSTPHVSIRPRVEESQEWILFSPSQAESGTNQTRTSQTVGLSRASDLGSLNNVGRSGRLESEVLDEDVTEDAELDSLDEGLHAFREPSQLPTISHPTQGPLLPTHDGLGMFPASSPQVLEQLWQHEQFNPKRKHEGLHRRTSSIQRRLETVEEIDAQTNEEKRMRIEKWRIDQSHAMMEEVQRETRRRLRRETGQRDSSIVTTEEILGSTPKQSDYFRQPTEIADDSEPFWRRITRKFIRDVIGIDEPLLSVILGESLPEDVLEPKPSSINLPTIPEQALDAESSAGDDSWRDRLLQRIAHELGVFVHQLSPHPGAFTTYAPLSQSPDYAGMPVTIQQKSQSALPRSCAEEEVRNTMTSNQTPNFPPTIQDPAHAESWGFEDEPTSSSSAHAESSLNLQREREYWEQQLDVKMVFRYLRDRFAKKSFIPQPVQNQQWVAEEAARRTAIIRQHHPLVARAHASPARLRRDSRLSARRPTSSCASESVKSSRKASLVKSGSSSRNYWDIGGSVGSGSIMASGGMMGAWGEA